MRLLKSLIIAVLLPLSTYGLSAQAASGIEQLHQFMDSTRSAKASFTQVIINKTGKAGKTARGTMIFQRPGKFRWSYETPYNQIIVGDGVKLWTYDKELNQVVIKPVGQIIGSSPAALLAGDNAFEKTFDVHDAGEANGLAWIEALPKSKEAGFERVRIGLKNNLPQSMEVQDTFGQSTKLEFSGFERNPNLSADTFRFTPPKGADVIGE